MDPGSQPDVDEQLEIAILDLLSRRAASSTICPSDAARAVGGEGEPTLILDSVPAHEAASAVGVNGLMRSAGTTLAAAVMATLLTSSTISMGAFEVPTESAFKWCFVVGALAAFVGVAIAAAVPGVVRRSAAGADAEASAPDTLVSTNA